MSLINTLQNFELNGATVFEIAGGRPTPAPLVKGVGTKKLGKGRVKMKEKHVSEIKKIVRQSEKSYSKLSI